MKKETRRLIELCISLFLCVVLLAIAANEREEHNYLKRTADSIFKSNFSQLCNNLNQSETEEINTENKKYSYLCFSVLSLTSFSDNIELNKIVHALYDLGERNLLYKRLDKTTVSDLNKLSRNLEDDTLINEVSESISKKNETDDFDVGKENFVANDKHIDIQILSQSTRGDEKTTYSVSNIDFSDDFAKLPSKFPVYVNDYSYGQEGPLYSVTDDLKNAVSDNLARFLKCLYKNFDLQKAKFYSDENREFEVCYANGATEVRSLMNSVSALSSEYGISDNMTDDELLNNELVKAAVAYLGLSTPTITRTVEYNTDGTENSITYVITEATNDAFQHVLNRSFARITVTKYVGSDEAVLQIGNVELDGLTKYADFQAISYDDVVASLATYYPTVDTSDIQAEIYYSATVQPGYFFPCYRFYIKDNATASRNGAERYIAVDVLLIDKK